MSFYLVAGLVSVFAGLAVASQSLLSVSAGALVVPALWAATRPVGRLALFAIGVMVMFQSSTFGLPTRGAFLAAAAAAAFFSFVRCRALAADLGVNVQPIRRAQVTIVAFCALQLLALGTQGARIEDWLRDATTYLLIACAPSLGLHAGLLASRKAIHWTVTLVGLTGATIFFVSSLARRGRAFDTVDQFALVSSMLVVPLIVLSLAVYLTTTSVRWLVVGVVSASLIVAPGGRTLALYLAAGAAFMILASLRWRRGALRAAVLLAVVTVAAVLTVSATVRLTGDDYLTTRLSFFTDASLTSVANDDSGAIRLVAYRIMHDEFNEHLFLGNGFGHNYPSAVTGVPTPGIFALDTPWTLLAKFGLLGAALLVGALAALLRGIVRMSTKNTHARQVVWLTVSGAAVMWLAALPGGLVLEQKGFGVALALLTAIGASWSRDEADLTLLASE